MALSSSFCLKPIFFLHGAFLLLEPLQSEESKNREDRRSMYRFVVLFALNLFYMIESKHQNPSTHQCFVLNEKIDQYSVFGSILTIGAMIGTFVHGKIADRLGRRMVSWLLDAGPLLIGYGIEFLSYVPVYIAEISPQNHRRAFTTVNKVYSIFLCGSFL
ncbi:putative MFS transporter superfamily [Helianthus anomalus]